PPVGHPSVTVPPWSHSRVRNFTVFVSTRYGIRGSQASSRHGVTACPVLNGLWGERLRLGSYTWSTSSQQSPSPFRSHAAMPAQPGGLLAQLVESTRPAEALQRSPSRVRKATMPVLPITNSSAG